jgi:phosphate starvation-inducible PhoH-like protein
MRDNAKPTKLHKMYDLALNDHDLLPVVASGSAGAGKTYGAAGAAVKWLAKNKNSKVLVTRPNVSFGEDLGFLPGTVAEKLEPWVRPIRENLANHGLSQKQQEELE